MPPTLSSIAGMKKELCPFCGNEEHHHMIAECGALGTTISRLEFWDDGYTLSAIDFYRATEEGDEPDGETE